MIKNIFHGFGGWIKTHWMEILAGTLIAVVALLAFSIGYIHCLVRHKEEVRYYESMLSVSEPTVCVLCRNNAGVKVHAPCIVNLSTGEVAELCVYDSHPTEPGEISAQLSKGYVSYYGVAGAIIMCNHDKELCAATLPKEHGKTNPEHFCYKCRRIISEQDNEGYVLADLSDPNSVSVYQIYNGVEYEFENYRITVSRTDTKCLEVKVHGLLGQES